MKNLENPEVWKKLQNSTAEFVVNEAQKLLSETIETAKILTDRAINILQFTIPLSLGIILILFDRSFDTLIFHVSVISLVVCGIVSWKCLKVYKLYEVLPTGNTPEKMLNPKKLDLIDERQLKAFFISAILSTQNSIEFNNNENKKRSDLMYSVINTLQLGTAIVISYTILWFPVFRSLFELLVKGQV